MKITASQAVGRLRGIEGHVATRLSSEHIRYGGRRNPGHDHAVLCSVLVSAAYTYLSEQVQIRVVVNSRSKSNLASPSVI